MSQQSRFGNKRICKRCKELIKVGKDKIGRVVFPGGLCYVCSKRKLKEPKT